MTTNLTKKLERIGLQDNQNTNRSVRWARAEWLDYRRERGFKSATDLLTPPGAQPKTGKNKIPTYALHLAPADRSGVEVCGWSTAGCRAACLNTAGRGRFDGVQRGRVTRTTFLNHRPSAFLAILEREIRNAVKRHGNILVRLNATSDLRWERFAPWLFEIEGAEFYDYTKAPGKARTETDGYALCYSANERNSDADLVDRLEEFGHVAICVDTPAPTGGGTKLPLPRVYLNARAWDGDETDDWRGRPGFTLLRAKGDAKGDTSGFVRPTHA